MALYRNQVTSVGKLPRVNKPRTLFDIAYKRVKSSLAHGVLTPFYVREVYPFDTFKVHHNIFIRGDVSAKVPLDDVYLDTFYFFVPYRIIDKDNFPKILGDRDDPLDNATYSVPQITLAQVDLTSDEEKNGFTSSFLNQLVYRLQYSQAGNYQKTDVISAYPVAAYYCIWNEFFRDENLNSKIPFKDLFNTEQFELDSSWSWSYFADPEDAGDMLDNYTCLGLYHVNKNIDLYTSGMISSQKGEAVSIPLGSSAPIYVDGLASSLTGNTDYLLGVKPSLADVANGELNLGNPGNQKLHLYSIDQSHTDNDLAVMYADLSGATAASINQLRIAFAVQSLYEMRGRYGTRYIETLSQWGANVPDDLVDRPVYLGGDSMPLSNIPVISSASPDNLGEMSGVSATLTNSANKWSKSFLEYGLVIGVACTRIKHVYTQGRDPKIWDYKTDLDFYHWIFANIGYVGTKNHSIYNDPSDSTNDEVFNYQEAFADLRTDVDVASGVFSPMSGQLYEDLRMLWTYSDYYDQRPVFSKEWLKEDASNVSRTLTGRIIPNSVSSSNGNQFLFDFRVKLDLARVMPAFSQPANLTLRW